MSALPVDRGDIELGKCPFNRPSLWGFIPEGQVHHHKYAWTIGRCPKRLQFLQREWANKMGLRLLFDRLIKTRGL